MITNNLNSHYAHIMNNKKNINSIKTQQTSIKNKINESVCICKYYDNDLFNFSVDSNDNYKPIIIINNYSVIFNNTKLNYPKDKTVIELFEGQVKKYPNNIAIVFERASKLLSAKLIFLFFSLIQKLLISYNLLLLLKQHP